jgi:hypothetical protein
LLVDKKALEEQILKLYAELEKHDQDAVAAMKYEEAMKEQKERQKQIAILYPELRVFFSKNRDKSKEKIRQKIVNLIDWSAGLNAFKQFCPYFKKQDDEIGQLIAEFKESTNSIRKEVGHLKLRMNAHTHKYSGLDEQLSDQLAYANAKNEKNLKDLSRKGQMCDF